MAVVLRLSRAGTHKAPFYHLVATDSRRPRDGKYLEDVGTYDPTVKPVKVQLKTERIEYWISKGAKPSPVVAMLIKKMKRGAEAPATPAMPAKKSKKTKEADAGA